MSNLNHARSSRLAPFMTLPLLFLLTTGFVPAQEEEVPIEAVLISFSEATGDIEFDVFSHSDTPIVAWEIKLVVRLSNGNEIVATSGWDFWLTGEDRYLKNGGSRRDSFNVLSLIENDELGDPPLELIPVGAVFTDGRSVGNEEPIEGIYHTRTGIASEYCRIAEFFDDLAENASSAQNLRESIETAIVSIEAAPILAKSAFENASNFEMFRFGLMNQRKESIGFLKSSFDSVSDDTIQKTSIQLRYKADQYRRYCSEAKSHLRQSDLNLMQRTIKAPSGR